MTESEIIKNACRRERMSLSELSRMTGIKYTTLYNERLAEGKGGNLRLYEIRQIAKHTGMGDKELLELVKGD